MCKRLNEKLGTGVREIYGIRTYYDVYECKKCGKPKFKRL